jgi:hypothetical protein
MAIGSVPASLAADVAWPAGVAGDLTSRRPARLWIAVGEHVWRGHRVRHNPSRYSRAHFSDNAARRPCTLYAS